jgi:hypothetical protein
MGFHIYFYENYGVQQALGVRQREVEMERFELTTDDRLQAGLA